MKFIEAPTTKGMLFDASYRREWDDLSPTFRKDFQLAYPDRLPTDQYFFMHDGKLVIFPKSAVVVIKEN